MRLICLFAPTVLILHQDILNAVMCVGILHTHCNNEYFGNLFILKAQIELSSISMSKNDLNMNKVDKYDVEASIDEVENAEDQSVFKYGFTALSNPKNVRLAIEGVARISGDSTERNEILDKDENDVPKILTMIYHELFPTFFLLSKNLNVSCPPHTIGAMGNSPISETEDVLEETQETADPSEEILETPETDENSEEVLEETQETAEHSDIAQPTV